MYGTKSNSHSAPQPFSNQNVFKYVLKSAVWFDTCQS